MGLNIKFLLDNTYSTEDKFSKLLQDYDNNILLLYSDLRKTFESVRLHEKQHVGLLILYIHTTKDFIALLRQKNYTPLTEKEVQILNAYSPYQLGELYKLLESLKDSPKEITIRYDVLDFKILALNVFARSKSCIPAIDQLSTKQITEVNATNIRLKLRNYKSMYSEQEYIELKTILFDLHAPIFHYYSNSNIAKLIPPSTTLQDINFTEIISEVSSANFENLLESLWALGLALYGNAYAEITRSNEFVYFGFDNLHENSSGYFHTLPNKILTTTDLLDSDSLYVTSLHRQAASLLAAFSVNFLKDYDLHIEIVLALWKASILKYSDYISIMAMLLSIIDHKKTMLEKTHLKKFLSEVQLHKFGSLGESFSIPYPLFILNTAAPNTYYETLLKGINNICCKENIIVPLKGDLLYKGIYSVS